MDTRPAAGNGAPVDEREVDTVLAACRVLVAISARSIAAVADVVDLTQLRTLVTVAGRRTVSLGKLAEAAGLGRSTASRTCDRLVNVGLLHRAEDPANRRQRVFTLTDQGSELVDQVANEQRAAVRAVLQHLPPARRAALAAALAEFAAAGAEATPQELSSLGWTG